MLNGTLIIRVLETEKEARVVPGCFALLCFLGDLERLGSRLCASACYAEYTLSAIGKVKWSMTNCYLYDVGTPESNVVVFSALKTTCC